MIIVNELITIEYETESKRDKHVEEMKEEGFSIKRTWSTVDVWGRNHIKAEYGKSQKGYLGKSIIDEKEKVETDKRAMYIGNMEYYDGLSNNKTYKVIGENENQYIVSNDLGSVSKIQKDKFVIITE